MSQTTIRPLSLLIAQTVHVQRFGEVQRGLNELNPDYAFPSAP